MTDNGTENYGVVQDFLQQTNHPVIQHITAQQDVEFSNSMIEAANKNIKYRILYHRHIPDFETLCRILPLAIEDYNNRPHDILNSLTPMEVLNGMQSDKAAIAQQMAAARTERIKLNKQEKCCHYSS